jgi:ribosomal protein S18 acetylase RimI-like enzyme
MTTATEIKPYTPEYHEGIRRILENIGWAEQYIRAAVQNADIFSANPDVYGAYVAVIEEALVGFIYVQYYAWNQLAQIQGLAVDPAFQGQGIATALVARAETFAQEKQARGIYVDTPTPNLRARSFYEAAGYTLGYIMPRYYQDDLDGVTYQKFFDRPEGPFE